MKVHSKLGPGLMESAYEACLIHDLRKQGLKAGGKVILPVIYEGEKIDIGYRIRRSSRGFGRARIEVCRIDPTRYTKHSFSHIYD
jgi:PD-(D/E)XK nuclease superfamily